MYTLKFIIIIFISMNLHSEEIEQQLYELLNSHPEINSLTKQLKSKIANTNHETTYPDPKFGLAFRNYPTRRGYSLNDKEYDTPGMTGIEYSISQEIPFPGRLTLQGKISKLNEVEFTHFLESKKNQFLTEFLSLSLRYNLLIKKISLNDEILKILDSLKNISNSKFSSGSSVLSQSLKFQIELNQYEERKIENQRDLKNYQTTLNYFLNKQKKLEYNIEDLEKFFNTKINLIKLERNDSKNKLIENPNYKLASVEIERAKNESKLSNLLHAPDTELFFSYMKRRNQLITIDNGPLDYRIMDNTEYRGDLFSFGVNVRLPVWSILSKNDLAERGNENLKSKVFELERNKLFLETNYEKFLNNLDSLEKQIIFTETKILPDLTKNLSILSSEYSSGKSNLLEVFLAKIEIKKASINKLDLQEKKFITVLLILELTNNLLNHKEN